MLEVSVVQITGGAARTIAIVKIDEANPKAKAEFVNPPDGKTVKLLRRALDQLDAEVEKA